MGRECVGCVYAQNSDEDAAVSRDEEEGEERFAVEVVGEAAEGVGGPAGTAASEDIDDVGCGGSVDEGEDEGEEWEEGWEG